MKTLAQPCTAAFSCHPVDSCISMLDLQEEQNSSMRFPCQDTTTGCPTGSAAFTVFTGLLRIASMLSVGSAPLANLQQLYCRTVFAVAVESAKPADILALPLCQHDVMCQTHQLLLRSCVGNMNTSRVDQATSRIQAVRDQPSMPHLEIHTSHWFPVVLLHPLQMHTQTHTNSTQMGEDSNTLGHTSCKCVHLPITASCCQLLQCQHMAL